MRKQFVAAMAMLVVAPAAFAGDAVTIKKPVTFNEDADIPKSVLDECKLDDELPAAIAKHAKENGIEVSYAATDAAPAQGRVMELEIYEAVADGNAFMGHHKSMGVKGKLVVDGQVVGSFKDRRISMGGAFGGFKGSCAVLSRITNEIGEDVGEWLKEPGKNAKLGDLE
ncbi:hypothetical protein [Luteibacter yeojuensis]|uniref:Uncharacterized protein n=1 Tax=Luteibacter yeojuensis TaxID=345309 RepID=A0A0F3KK03_9GAMM|nr:hypothetical protein [Luteibacter yeojuensis]KJV31317.1 hypothetical protein VI08_13820 [Luteibacter yeojuensis]